jgi:hypothetical protein
VKLAAISVDLDEIGCYTQIHGLTAPEPEAAFAIYEKAVPRLARLFEQEGVTATFFAIGSDLARPESAAALKRLSKSGHEIANHSQNHLYDLTRRDRRTIEAEVRDGADAIERACGIRPVGFRAPGYTITDAIFDVLAGLGVLYDSSVFPCPAYYAAKSAAIALIRARGRKSHSIVDDPRVLGAPADPYRVGRPYWRRGAGVVELPIGVTKAWSGRLPFIGTSVVLAGEAGATQLTRLAATRPVVSLELHGIDLADADEDGLGFLAAHQPDLRKTAAQKESALRASIAELRSRGYRFVTCTEAARTVA